MVAFQGKGKAMMAFQGKGEGHGSLPKQGGRPWWYSKARGKAMVVFKGKVIVIFRVDGKDI